jgi:hypothetical protein
MHGTMLFVITAASLRAVEVRPSPLSSVRKIPDVMFSYTNRDTDVVKLRSSLCESM